MGTLDEIEARADAATEGPWRLYDGKRDSRDAAVETSWSYDEDGADTELITDWCHAKDAEFIAHARQDVPRLIGAVKWLADQLHERSGGDPEAWAAEALGGDA